MPLQIFQNPDKISEAAARQVSDIAAEAVKDRGKFTVALSGGGSPKQTYELLASEAFKNEIPWEYTYVFWGDERFVPPDDPQNNARMARKTLLNQVPIPSDQVYPIPTDGSPEEAAKRYSDTLDSFWGNASIPRLDLILLGLGENGHTASLFPETEVLEEKNKWVAPVYVEEQDQYRITLTAPVINNARNITFIVFGEKKAAVLQKILQGPEKPQQWPAQLIDPKNGTLSWYIDNEAGKFLS